MLGKVVLDKECVQSVWVKRVMDTVSIGKGTKSSCAQFITESCEVCNLYSWVYRCLLLTSLIEHFFYTAQPFAAVARV